MRAKRGIRGLVAEQDYEVVGIWTDTLDGEKYYQTGHEDKIILYHVSHFYPEVTVDDDEF